MNADRAEAAFWAAFLRNRNVDVGTARDGAIAVAGGYAVCAAGTYQSIALAIGSTRALRPDDLQVLREFFEARDRPVRLEMREQAVGRDLAVLDAAGFTVTEPPFVVYDAAVGDAAAPEVKVRVADRREWVRIVTAAFAEGAAPDATTIRSAELSASAAAGVFVAEVDGVPAGAAALGHAGEYAYLFSGAVLPQFRRRGVHRALIQARLAFARSRGLGRAFVKVAAGSDGERAMRRAGFEPGLVLRRAHVL